MSKSRYYTPRLKIKGICPTCEKEFHGRPHKVYCTYRCSPGYKVPKKLSKRHIARVPKWTNKKEVLTFYMKCPTGMQVDHIIPLNHPDVSGLHVLENLQYITPEQNAKKSNLFDGTSDNNSWKETSIAYPPPKVIKSKI